MRYDVSGSGTEDLSPVHEQKLRIFPHLKLFQALCGQHCGHVHLHYRHGAAESGLALFKRHDSL